MTTKKEIQTFCLNAMKRDKRDNGETFYTFNDEVITTEIKNLLYKAGFEVKDFYYSTLSDAFSDLEYFLKSNELEDLNDFKNNIYQYTTADIYVQDLLNWLSEEVYNIERVNEALNETGTTDIVSAMQDAQQQHKTEIYQMVLGVVQLLVDKDEV
jgi:DNA-binding transcriptional MerR regulator